MNILPNHPGGLDELSKGQEDWLVYNYQLQTEAAQKAMDEGMGAERAMRSLTGME